MKKVSLACILGVILLFTGCTPERKVCIEKVSNITSTSIKFDNDLCTYNFNTDDFTNVKIVDKISTDNIKVGDVLKVTFESESFLPLRIIDYSKINKKEECSFNR